MMNQFRLHFLPLALALSGLALSSCKKEDTQPQTTITAQQQQLVTGSWRLDEIKQDGQVTSTGSGIKDRYSLTFRTDGTYTQKLLADNTTYNGTWMLMSNNTVLHLTDHKGDSNDYTLASLTATQLRYTYTTKTNQLEERTFSAQP
jgi:hypothetical protein